MVLVRSFITYRARLVLVLVQKHITLLLVYINEKGNIRLVFYTHLSSRLHQSNLILFTVSLFYFPLFPPKP